MEDRLNPIAPEGTDEGTLGGYRAVHGRSAAFEGSDGLPYTVAVETDPADDGQTAGYLVFVRWAENSTAIMGHLTTDDLICAPTEAEARAALDRLTLVEVKGLLDAAIANERDWLSQ